jgi:hypothetical protein
VHVRIGRGECEDFPLILLTSLQKVKPKLPFGFSAPVSSGCIIFFVNRVAFGDGTYLDIPDFYGPSCANCGMIRSRERLVGKTWWGLVLLTLQEPKGITDCD